MNQPTAAAAVTAFSLPRCWCARPSAGIRWGCGPLLCPREEKQFAPGRRHLVGSTDTHNKINSLQTSQRTETRTQLVLVEKIKR